MVGLEDVRHLRGDFERDRDVSDRGCSREANGVVEQDLVAPALDDQLRQAGQVRKYRAATAASTAFGLTRPTRGGWQAQPTQGLHRLSLMACPVSRDRQIQAIAIQPGVLGSPRSPRASPRCCGRGSRSVPWRRAPGGRSPH